MQVEKEEVLITGNQPKTFKYNNFSIVSASIVALVDSYDAPEATMGSISEEQTSVHNNDMQEMQVENEKEEVVITGKKSSNLPNTTLPVMKNQFVNSTTHHHILDTCQSEKCTIM